MKRTRARGSSVYEEQPKEMSGAMKNLRCARARAAAINDRRRTVAFHPFVGQLSGLRQNCK